MAVKRILSLVAAVAMMLGVIALPAAAENATAVFAGFMDVGTSVVTPCTKAPGDGVPTGTGLKLPGAASPNLAHYRFTAPLALAYVGEDSGEDVGGDLDICGKLTDVFGVGAACGMSKGYDGKGKIFDSAAVVVAQVSDVGWKASAGSTLPIIGRATDPATKTKRGTLVGVVQAQGGAACITAGGATSFTVVGSAQIVQGVSLTPNNITNLCDTKAAGAGGLCLLDIWGPKK